VNPVRFKRHAGKQPQRLPRDLSNDAVEQLWAVITTPRDRAWFALMLRTGLRVGEVVSLRLTDVLVPPQADQPARLRVCGKGTKGAHRVAHRRCLRGAEGLVAVPSGE
jgi:site-specific recombinase XerC